MLGCSGLRKPRNQTVAEDSFCLQETSSLQALLHLQDHLNLAAAQRDYGEPKLEFTKRTASVSTTKTCIRVDAALFAPLALGSLDQSPERPCVRRWFTNRNSRAIRGGFAMELQHHCNGAGSSNREHSMTVNSNIAAVSAEVVWNHV